MIASFCDLLMGASNSAVVTEFSPSRPSSVKIGKNELKYATVEAKGRREYMEDFCHCTTDHVNGEVKDVGWFAVFDGHGGSRVAEHCANHMYTRLMETPPMLENALEVENISRGLHETFLIMDDEVDELAPMLLPPKSSGLCFPTSKEQYETTDFVGTTATCGVITPTHIFVAHVGDSRALLVSKGGIKYETTDHHPENEVEKQRILKGQGTVERNRIEGALAVSRALGDFVYKRDLARRISEQWVVPIPEVKCFERTEEDDYLIIASDGLWCVFDSEDLVEYVSERIIKNKMDIDRCCDELMEECLINRRSSDNIAIVIVKLSGKTEGST